MLPSSEVLAVAQIAEMELCFFNKTAAHHLLRHVYHHQEKALRSLRCFPRWTHDRGSKLKQDSFLSNKGLLHTLRIAYAMAALRFARKVGMKQTFTTLCRAEWFQQIVPSQSLRDIASLRCVSCFV